MKYLLLFLFTPLLIQAQPMADNNSIDINALRSSVSFLAADSLAGRFTGSDGAAMAAKFIAAKYAASGLQPTATNTGFFDSFPAYYNGKKMMGINVVGLLPASEPIDTFIIFSAHYDHLGTGRDIELNKDYRHDDKIFNGANDNATGVAVLLELANHYSRKTGLRYNLLFIAFAGEELGMVGSSAFANKINLTLIKTVINIEMLGRPVKDECYIISLGNRKLKNNLNEMLRTAGVAGKKDFFRNDPYYEEELAYRSDHYPFAKKIKNAFTIMASSPTDEYYHTVDDEYKTIDFDFLLNATRKIAVACEYFFR